MLDRRAILEDDLGAAPGSEAREPTASAPPRLSVIVTNRDYGHFLDACLQSVLDQTVPVDEIVVVDDGSTDGSEAVLERHAGHVAVVRTGGRGQAGAFNAGFAAASGTAILFLDADDVLRPEAAELIREHWHADLAQLVFGLERIDAGGRSVGLHDLALTADDGDNRPKILRGGSLTGSFVFAPTSGNVFNRAALEPLMPMPEDAWRICADAWLVRAVGLTGRVRAVRRVLGGYRVHGGNHYNRHDTFTAWSMGRGLRDLEIKAEALDSIAASRVLPGDRAAEMRMAARLLALEIRGRAAVWTRDLADFRRRAVRAAGQALAEPLPLGQRLSAVAAIGRFAAATVATRRLDSPELGDGPASLRPAAGSALERRLAALDQPRWPDTVPFGTPVTFESGTTSRGILAEGWSGMPAGGVNWSLRGAAALVFALPPARGAVEVEIDLTVSRADAERGVRLSVSADGRRVWCRNVDAAATARFHLDRDPERLEQVVRIEIAATTPRRRPLPPRAAAFGFARLRVGPAVGDRPAPVLRPDQLTDPASLTPADAAEWQPRADAAQEMNAAAAALRLHVEPGTQRADVVLGIADGVPAGWLTVADGSRVAFSGRVAAGGSARIGLAGRSDPVPRPRDLHLAFTAGEPGRLALSSVALAPAASRADRPAVRHRLGDPALTLAPGQTLHLGTHPLAGALLSFGWGAVRPSGVRNVAPEAGLAFRTITAGDLTATLRLRPLLPDPGDRRLIVGISLGGRVAAVGDLRGEGEFSVPLPRTEAGKALREMTLHAFFAADEAGADDGIATVELVALTLSGDGEAPRLPPARPYPRPECIDLIDEACRLRETPAGLDEIVALRDRIAATLLSLEPRAIRMLAARPGALGALAWLGDQTAGLLPDPAAASVEARMRPMLDSGAPSGDRLRALLAGMSTVPSYRTGIAARLGAVPALLLVEPEPFVEWLCREPRYVEPQDRRAYVSYLERLMSEAADLLAREPQGAPLHDLAARLVMGLRNTTALFGDVNLAGQIRARAAAIERLLVQTGASLAQVPRPREDARRLRMAVLVRNLAATPEGWSARAMYRGLDPDRFDLTLVTTDGGIGDLPAGPRFDAHLRLAGLSVAEAVATIRAEDFDLLVLGAYVANWERVTSIAAHRLARLQISACFNNPTTLGLKSFDHAIAWHGAGDAQDQHTERLVTIDANLQCCFDFTGLVRARDEDAAAVRRRLDLPLDGALLVSGAMAYKIQSEAMAAWAEILSASDAHLVLYPFAPVWHMRHGAELFRRRLDWHLAAGGVGPDRVTVLPAQSSPEVWRLLSAADVYLDSLPYSGATTVCEALACGCPVVTCEGRMLRQRTGTAWLRRYGLDGLVARTPAGYVEAALRLARDPETRAAARSRIDAANAAGPPFADWRRFGAASSDTLWRLAQESGLFPGLAPQPRETSVPAVVPPGRRRRLPFVDATERFVVLSTPRTGSTLLCDILTSAPNCLVDYELFHRSRIQYGGGQVTDPEAIASRDAAPLAFLQRREETTAASGYTMTGFKLFLFHDARVLDHVLSEPRYRLILLTRENRLAQYSSHVIAHQTGQWELRDGEAPTRRGVVFDPQHFEAFEDWLNRVHQRMLEGLYRHGRDILLVEYASLSSPATLQRLSDCLGRAVTIARRPNLARQNPTGIVDRFTNRAETLAYLERRNLRRWADGG
jgi:predicted O-linked N-acetylglucosamine transferase (SPINDLY family)/LPS sulfotransferase NodH